LLGENQNLLLAPSRILENLAQLVELGFIPEPFHLTGQGKEFLDLDPFHLQLGKGTGDHAAHRAILGRLIFLQAEQAGHDGLARTGVIGKQKLTFQIVLGSDARHRASGRQTPG
jgi:hypothetical protein